MKCHFKSEVQHSLKNILIRRCAIWLSVATFISPFALSTNIVFASNAYSNETPVKSGTIQLIDVFNSRKSIVAQFGDPNIIFLGQIGPYDTWQDPSDDFVLVFVGGAIWFFTSVSSAVESLGYVFAAKSGQKPSAADCNKAIKLLTQYKRLSEERGVKLTENVLQYSGQIC